MYSNGQLHRLNGNSSVSYRLRHLTIFNVAKYILYYSVRELDFVHFKKPFNSKCFYNNNTVLSTALYNIQRKQLYNIYFLIPIIYLMDNC